MKPVLQALVVAERIYEVKGGRKVICGTFNSILISERDNKIVDRPDGTKAKLLAGGDDMGCPWVYVNLTDVVAGTKIGLEMVNVSKNIAIFGSSFEITEARRLGTVELALPLPHPREWAKEPGTFSLDLTWEGEILGSHRLVVAQKEVSEEGESQ